MKPRAQGKPSSNGCSIKGENDITESGRRLMISSSEVGGCCRVQVPRFHPFLRVPPPSERPRTLSLRHPPYIRASRLARARALSPSSVRCPCFANLPNIRQPHYEEPARTRTRPSAATLPAPLRTPRGARGCKVVLPSTRSCQPGP